ncbi:MAG: ParB/RepB/Spo0J family partition protein [Candidatus Cloacimonetes bacterium]|nr:ParB/RepB/Spo0J family partition protein [Candidatus Cloacimonadota bacterium]
MRRLGRGLESLIQDVEAPVTGAVTTIKVEYIRRNRFQPRKIFDPEKLKELSVSIKENGLIQPIVVVKHTDIDFELIAGERRLEACKLADIQSIPVYIREVSDTERLVLAIIENVQRENLSPIEEAKAYQRLIDEFEFSHQDIAKTMNKDRVTVTNILRLLKLSENIQTLIESKKLTSGHARAILSVDEELQEKFAQEIIEKQYNVRKAEDEARHFCNITEKSKPAKRTKIYEKKYLKSIEESLSQAFGLSVKIKERKNAAGEIVVSFENKDSLEKLVNYLVESKQVMTFTEELESSPSLTSIGEEKDNKTTDDTQ